MWPFKKKNTPYTPNGRVGYYRVSSYPYNFTLIVEELTVVSHRSKVKILEVDLDSDCRVTKKQCIRYLGWGEWVRTSYINWETDEQRLERLGQQTPVTYQVQVNKSQEIQYKLTPHIFSENYDN